MITYLYWTAIFILTLVPLYILGFKAVKWKAAVIVASIILLTGWSTYYFRLQQVFVKRYGGVMTIRVPEGRHHLGATWKDDNLWIENYNPETNTCIFSEYSKGNLLQGRVTIKNCNPLLPRQPGTDSGQ
ncbi:hypothetical protein DGMP_33320 [Desulfomarina profundi]|uniref:Uncharacterized protein n=1 Tax=Desulfomarina profundi TaxID=2772557 RepID=A0A8D5FQN7_9BACT|nr:hypothetical protein [Desulfomarina profundi]BCL62639.1 hypothetical protein DGMP_33320 [Desulfomarina profundi]